MAVEGSTLSTRVIAAGGSGGSAAAGGAGAAYVPEARFAHAAVALAPQSMAGGAMLVFAGVTPSFDLSDLAMWLNVDPAVAAAAAAHAPPPIAAAAPAPRPAPAPASDLD